VTAGGEARILGLRGFAGHFGTSGEPVRRCSTSAGWVGPRKPANTAAEVAAIEAETVNYYEGLYRDRAVRILLDLKERGIEDPELNSLIIAPANHADILRIAARVSALIDRPSSEP
jgi:hypothetical protein